MRPHDSHQGRRSNRGPRRSRRNGPGGYDGAPRNGSHRQEPEKKTFWQKITAFFTGGKTPASEQPVNGTGPSQERPASRRSGKPEFVEVTSPKLYVGNLSFEATESDLFDLFNGVGIVKNAEIVSDRYTQRSKGFAFVTMQTTEEARRAVTELHDKEFMGRKLLVNGAKTNGFHSDRGDN